MEQTLYLGTSYGFERKESPSWKDMLELSSSSGGSDDYRRTNFLGFNDTPELEAPAEDMLTNGTVRTLYISLFHHFLCLFWFGHHSLYVLSEDNFKGIYIKYRSFFFNLHHI